MAVKKDLLTLFLQSLRASIHDDRTKFGVYFPNQRNQLTFLVDIRVKAIAVWDVLVE